MKKIQAFSKQLTPAKLQFYADNKGNYTNKLFTFKVTAFSDIERILRHFFDNDNNIRAAFQIMASGQSTKIAKEELQYYAGIISKSDYQQFLMRLAGLK